MLILSWRNLCLLQQEEKLRDLTFGDISSVLFHLQGITEREQSRVTLYLCEAFGSAVWFWPFDVHFQGVWNVFLNSDWLLQHYRKRNSGSLNNNGLHDKGFLFLLQDGIYLVPALLVFSGTINAKAIEVQVMANCKWDSICMNAIIDVRTAYFLQTGNLWKSKQQENGVINILMNVLSL